jgi:hypothetical protein
MCEFRRVFGFGGAMAVVMAACGGAKVAAQTDGKPANRDVELTVYKDDFAMVSELRPVLLESGHTKLVIDDISKGLDPNSILFEWPGMRNRPQILSTTYNLGLGSGVSLMSRLNGQQIEFMWPSNNGNPGAFVSGKLEAAEDGSGFALRTPDRLYVNPSGTIVASPKTASTLPQLSVDLNSGQAADTRLGMSYLTRGMSWSADYVAKLNPSGKSAEIECWATVINKTGIPFPAAKLTLMAGSVNRAVQGFSLGPGSVTGGLNINGNVNATAGVTLQNSDSSIVARMSVGELYAYEIPARATIGLDQMNRVSVLGTRTVPIKRTYSIRIPTLTSWGYMGDGVNFGARPHVSATVALSFANNAASNLGIPLPSGDVRVYERDDTGRERYTGAASIPDTPKTEHVSLTLGNAFDVFAGYRVVKSERISKHKVRKSVEATLHNEKKGVVQLRVIENFSNPWLSISESVKSERLDSQTILWNVSLKPGEVKKIAYTVDIKE